MNSDNIELADVAEVLAQIISQEKIMAVPPVIIPTDGADRPRNKPRKQKRNKYYIKKDPREVQSVSVGNTPPTMPEGFPIETSRPGNCSVDTFQQPTNKSFVAKRPDAIIKKAKKQQMKVDNTQPNDLEVLTYIELEGAR